ncbi:MAG: rhomboid family intramembrane serine protease [Geodermatophilaceae bacterium]|nr:rhomboid family intramembrane serine protease [Geodermatophilaceae bacterium]MDQ3465498.1 rhomboid family intramembrane serine protease [Actinomycetota bacterium]
MTPFGSGPGQVQPAATCYRHADRPTGIGCTRCGRPICPDCMRSASVGFHCPDCVREGQATVRQPRSPSGLRRFADRWGAATTTLVVINVAVYVVTVIAALPNGGGVMQNSTSSLFHQLSLIPACATGEFPVLGGCATGGEQPWRLLSSAFLHFGLFHLAMNMLALLVLGADLERYLGWAKFAGLYLVSALSGGAAVALFAQANSETVGASGGVFGLLGAAAVVIRHRKGDLRPLISVLVLNAVISFLPGISLLGHLGGLIGGSLAAVVLIAARRSTAMQVAGLAAVAFAAVVPVLVQGAFLLG